jgi:signal transduction histidine kinase
MRIFEQPIESNEDVFAARQRGREIAALAGFDNSDQVRVAIALSELGRDVLSLGHAGSATFELDETGERLVVAVDGFHPDDVDACPGVAAARRLMSTVDVEPTDGGAQVVMTRRVPRALIGSESHAIRARILRQVMLSPLDELRAQNRELLTALEELQTNQAALVQVNAELEETNRGVMAMYAQLSDELDSTNRGVVALYNELDDKNRQIAAAAEAKSRFLYSVSHELRSPVTSIVGLSRLLLDPVSERDEAEAHHRATLINNAATELLELVTQLLSLAKADAGRLDPHIAPTDIAPVLAEVADALRPLARDGVEVAVEVDQTPFVLDTDPTLFRQVVRNLVANAIAFTESGAVTVRAARRAGDAVTISVQDTGIGIPPDDIERVFEEFYQVRSRLQVGRRGTGLGLAYSRLVAEELGATLTGTSEPGTGSVFTIRMAPPAAEGREVVAPSDDGARWKAMVPEGRQPT